MRTGERANERTSERANEHTLGRSPSFAVSRLQWHRVLAADTRTKKQFCNCNFIYANSCLKEDSSQVHNDSHYRNEYNRTSCEKPLLGHISKSHVQCAKSEIIHALEYAHVSCTSAVKQGVRNELVICARNFVHSSPADGCGEEKKTES
ncbi:hypothetical protein POVWA1_042230 [Plasmodium ovale wallikeri]|uniref:Uncharacterized protein n=1 Tax=Plasmodium ovale wallikeri TaxID=864142 RepID=A0A1A8Z9K8_PLAOA|nr:hypothetical protein POVWA1_042230 [Plasmodium ovale wallikeri]